MLTFLVFALGVSLASAYSGGWDPHYCCYPPPDECCPPNNETCPTCQDIAIIADRSSSIGEVRYKFRILPLLRELAQSSEWTVGSGLDQYQFSVTTFAGVPSDPPASATLHWNWGDAETDSEAALLMAINGIEDIFVPGTTRVEEGMKIVRQQVINGPGDRAACPNTCIVITDGAFTNPGGVAAELPLFQTFCDKIIAIGVTTSVAEDELMQIASASDFVIKLSDFPDVPASLPAVEQAICTNVPICPSCLDIVIIQDMSSSVGIGRFEYRVKPFLEFFATSREWRVGFDSPDTKYQFAMVTFNTQARLRWNWGDAQTSNRVIFRRSINEIDSNGAFGITNMGAAFKIAREQVLTNNDANDRPGCSNVCVIVSDGEIVEQNFTATTGPTPFFEEQLPLFQQYCDSIVVLGISTRVDPDQLNSIATVADNVLLINEATMENLEMAFANITDRLCDQLPPVTTPDTDLCCPFDFPQYARLMQHY